MEAGEGGEHHHAAARRAQRRADGRPEDERGPRRPGCGDGAAACTEEPDDFAALQRELGGPGDHRRGEHGARLAAPTQARRRGGHRRIPAQQGYLLTEALTPFPSPTLRERGEVFSCERVSEGAWEADPQSLSLWEPGWICPPPSC